MALLLAYGIWQAVPDERAVDALRDGRDALSHQNYSRAMRSYSIALSLVPNSAVARQGLACASYYLGMRSAATMELTKGLEAGVFAERLGHCGHGLNLDDVFFTAKLGLSDAFAVPRVAGAEGFEEALREEPKGTTAEEPGRMLLGACLAHRAGFAGAAWDYAANALQADAIAAADRASFFACLGSPRARGGCLTVRNCLMTPAARKAYFAASRLVNDPSRGDRADDS
jgi:hypothetical protein